MFFSFWGKLYLTENVKKIGRSAFVSASYGGTVGDGTYAAQLPDSIEVIEERAFSGYPVKNLPKNLKYLGDEAFVGDEEGKEYIGFVSKEVIFPENIEYIGRMTFYKCSEIERVVIPEYFKDIEIKDTIFDYCNNIKTVCYEGNIYNSNIVYPEPSNVEVKEGVTVFNGPRYNSEITEFIIPEGIVEITNGSFDQCENLKTIKFPSTLKKIGSGVLGSCPALEKIEFDEKSTGIEIGEGFIGGFEDGEKNKIETFHFPAYVTKVGSGFASGRNLKSITSESLPVKSYSVTQDESGKNTYNIIFGNPGITEITETSWFGSFSYFDREGEATINYIIEEGIEVIDGISPFIDYYDEVKNITIKLPSTLKRIERFASRSEFIKEIEIPDSVEYIGDGAFSGFGLSTVKINDTSNLKYIGSSAFSSCSIKEIYIPKTVEYIGRGAFSEKCDITKFISRAKCDFNINEWTSYGSIQPELKLEQNNIRIYGSTEYGLTSLDYYFNQDYGIILYGEEVDLILSTTSKVKFVCVDSDVKKICKMLSTFDSNSNINKLVPFIFKSETPPVFYGTNDDNDLFFGGGTEKIYVPDNSVETYKSIYTWGKNRITKISELPYELEEMLWE